MTTKRFQYNHSTCWIIGLIDTKQSPTKPLFLCQVNENKKSIKDSRKHKRIGRRTIDVASPLRAISNEDLINLVKVVNENNQYMPFPSECRYTFAMCQKRILKFGDYILPWKLHCLIFRFCLQDKHTIYPDGSEPAFNSSFTFAGKKNNFMCVTMHQGETFRMKHVCSGARHSQRYLTPSLKSSFLAGTLYTMQVRRYIFFALSGTWNTTLGISLVASSEDDIFGVYMNFLKELK